MCVRVKYTSWIYTPLSIWFQCSIAHHNLNVISAPITRIWSNLIFPSWIAHSCLSLCPHTLRPELLFVSVEDMLQDEDTQPLSFENTHPLPLLSRFLLLAASLVLHIMHSSLHPSLMLFYPWDITGTIHFLRYGSVISVVLLLCRWSSHLSKERAFTFPVVYMLLMNKVHCTGSAVFY